MIFAAPPLIESTFPPALSPVNCRAASAPPSQCGGMFDVCATTSGSCDWLQPPPSATMRVTSVGLELPLGRQQGLFRRQLLLLRE